MTALLRGLWRLAAHCTLRSQHVTTVGAIRVSSTREDNGQFSSAVRGGLEDAVFIYAQAPRPCVSGSGSSGVLHIAARLGVRHGSEVSICRMDRVHELTSTFQHGSVLSLSAPSQR